MSPQRPQTSLDDRRAYLITDVIRGCQPGEPPSGALRTVALDYFDRTLEAGDFEHIETTARLIEDSPALQARQQADAAAFAAAVAEAAFASRQPPARTSGEPNVGPPSTPHYRQEPLSVTPASSHHH